MIKRKTAPCRTHGAVFGKEAIQRVSQFGSDQKKQKSWERENVRFLDSAIANIKNNLDVQLKKIVPLAIRLKIS